jgi:hypothetical protein
MHLEYIQAVTGKNFEVKRKMAAAAAAFILPMHTSKQKGSKLKATAGILMKLPSAAPPEESGNENPEVIFPSSRAEHRRNGRKQVLSLFEAFRHRREAEFERAPPVLATRREKRGAGRWISQGHR